MLSNLTSRQLTKSVFRKICLEIGLTSIETHLLIKLISDTKGPKKSLLESQIKHWRFLLKAQKKTLNLHQENQELILAVQKHLKLKHIKLPFATYACNTQFLSKKAFTAMLSEIKAPISNMQFA